MGDRRRYNDSVPQEGSIVQGKVIRLEPSFCILQLHDFYRMRGLLHVSEMELNGAKLDETMLLDDVLYCRVLSITIDEGPEGQPRQRIKLSTRGVDTKTGEESAASVSNAQQQQLSQNLNSTIGMGVALDPMANSSLILKSDKSSGSALINGYALVGDTEGEPDLPPPEPLSRAPMGRGRGSTLPAWMSKGDGPSGGGANVSTNKEPVRPMGRGRGTTLPAWMTHGNTTKEDSEDSRKHDKHQRKEKKKHSRKKSNDRDEGRDRRHSSRKHRHREERKPRHESPHDSDRRDESSQERRHHKKHRRRHRRSPSFDSIRGEKSGESREGDRLQRRDDRKSRRRSPSHSDESDRGHSRKRKKHHRRSRRRSYSDSSRSERNGKRPRSESHASSGGGSYRRNDRKSEHHEASRSKGKAEAEFSCVADAERLIAELENKKRRH